MVSNISINNKLGMFVTSSFDGTVNLYTLDHEYSLQRTFNHAKPI